MPSLPHHIRLAGLLTALGLVLSACPRAETGTSRADPQRLVGSPPAQGIEPSARAEATPKRRGLLWYRITPGASSLAIQLRLLRPPEQLSLFLPGPWAGQDDWTRHIRIHRARTPTGLRPITLHRQEGRLDLDLERDAAWVELDYEVTVTERDGEATRFAPQRAPRSQGFFAYAPTLFILPSERVASSLVEIPVEILTPDTWTLLTTWSLAQRTPSKQLPDTDVYGFIVSDVRALRDAFITASPALTLDARADLQIAYEPSFGAARASFSEAIAALMTAYQARFGATTPHTAVLVRSPSSQLPRTLWGTGRQGGFVLELDANATLDHDTRLLIAHEAFHLWNGHALIPDPTDEAETRWFKEGVTHYIALKMIYTLGWTTERALLAELAEAAERYTQQGRLARSAHASAEHARYPYDRGVLLALGLDAALRRETQGRLGIEDWLGAALERARLQPDWTYDLGSLGAILSALTSPDGEAMTFWLRACARDEALNLEDHFAQLGLHWLRAERARKARLVPLTGRDSSWRTLLDQTTWQPQPSSSNPP